MARLIAIDGLDGSGKETQSLLLKEYLEKKGKKVRLVSFPTYDEKGSVFVKMYLDGAFGAHPGDTNAYAASVFFALDRYYSFHTDWINDYSKDDVYILANRYTTANAVHQLSKMPSDKWDEFLSWLLDFEFHKLALPEPDDVIYLELHPETSISLINKREKEQQRKKDIHEKDPEHLKNSYRAALYSCEKLGWIKIKCEDGNNNIKTRKEISRDIISALGV